MWIIDSERTESLAYCLQRTCDFTGILLFRVGSLGRGRESVRPPPEAQIVSKSRNLECLTHPFPTSLAHGKGRQRARHEHSENENEETNFPHAGVEGHDGGRRERP